MGEFKHLLRSQIYVRVVTVRVHTCAFLCQNLSGSFLDQPFDYCVIPDC